MPHIALESVSHPVWAPVSSLEVTVTLVRTTLMTKFLLPRRREDLLTRQRLLDHLYDMIDYKVVMISAPAGYGKTTLLVDFAGDLEHPVCWLALDAGDRDPRVFLEHLVLSLQRRFPEFGDQTLRALDATSNLRDGAQGVVKVMVNEIVETIPRWFAIVLDDYHALGDAPEVNAIVSNFLAYQSDQGLMFITSRVVPDLPLIIRLVARGGVGGIGQAELRFRAPEVQALFAQNFGVTLSEDEADELVAQSEGWITGLLLTATTRWQGVVTRLMQARDDDHQPIHEYLAQEVFSQQDAAMQQFLLDSSTLHEMNATLLDNVFGIAGSAEMLEQAEIHNLFVSKLESGWYRYHRLFAEYLQKRLRETQFERWESLHLKAASWFEDQARLEPAVDHYLEIDRQDEAARLMLDQAHPLFVDGRWATLMDWRHALDEDVLIRHPLLALFQSRAAERLGRWDQALALVDVVEAGYRRTENHEGLAYAMLHRCQVWLRQGQAARAEALAREALLLIETQDLPVAYEAYRILGKSVAAQGRWAEATTSMMKARNFCTTQGTPYTCASIQSHLAECLRVRGRLQEALHARREAVRTWKVLDNDGVLAGELNDLGFLSYASGAYAEALRWFEEALTLARQTGQRRVEAFALVSLGELTRDLDLLDHAEHYCAQGLALAETLGDGFLSIYGREALGLVHRVAGQWAEALALIEEALRQAEAQNAAQQRGRCHASLGAVRVEAGAYVEGIAHLDRAVTILEPLGASLDYQRARFLRAWAYFQADDRDRAADVLLLLRDESDEAFESMVLVAEGRWTLPMLDAIKTRWAEADCPEATAWLDRALIRIEALVEEAGSLFPESQTPAPSEVPGIRVYGFGVGQVEVGGERILPTDWGSAAARNLLFYMLLNERRSREQIFSDLWPTLSPQKAKAAFHTTKFRLKRALGVDAVDYDGRVYRIDPTLDIWFDVAHFNQALGAGHPDAVVEEMIEAVRLYTGDFLPDCYDDWCIQTREHLRERCLHALETLSDRLLARRQYRRAIEVLQRAVTLEPIRESMHRQLMRAYALAGERIQALQQYESCAQLLRSEFGVEPSRRTRTLHQQIMDEVPLN